MNENRSWIERRVANHNLSYEFRDGVERFLDFGYSNDVYVYKRTIRCPCHESKQECIYKETIRCPCHECRSTKFLLRDKVAVHLCKKGFIPHYTWWILHGEARVMGESSTTTDDFIDNDKMNDNGCWVPEFDWNANETPNAKAS
ncbi:Transposon, En/Spm-like, Transposase-associated domain protein [Quillaja saponaria]|uniref:Transposon, En/Spm-like, Transposase-associated domain protein n=1 Tax=Quillaja saponaria TaxID=32244 RepID=A0AAD7LPW8_QUISA|nr:Transposon, En/Spm-like, Transposase-associated domain protein [Quillaja saponaria]